MDKKLIEIQLTFFAVVFRLTEYTSFKFYIKDVYTKYINPIHTIRM